MTQQERYKAFAKTFGELEGFRSNYRGRYFYDGPALVVERDAIQQAIKESPVPVQWDNLGLDLIVYPK